MYSIAEKHPSAGNVNSRDNCRLWINRAGESTPASDEAAEFASETEAREAARWAGISDLGEDDSNWEIVDLED